AGPRGQGRRVKACRVASRICTCGWRRSARRTSSTRSSSCSSLAPAAWPRVYAGSGGSWVVSPLPKRHEDIRGHRHAPPPSSEDITTPLLYHQRTSPRPSSIIRGHHHAAPQTTGGHQRTSLRRSSNDGRTSLHRSSNDGRTSPRRSSNDGRTSEDMSMAP
ncbi:uncharacterized protein LOC118478779, partial [Aplysia californica]|uniref:Uncharacterized protein LOC118478779 n=1 Tax=Aplysia californica TaxID=6500 RepID=A0ABM1W2I5_APLCA